MRGHRWAARVTAPAPPPPDPYGPELVVNGGFEADTDWVKESGWTIAGGKASCSSGGYPTIHQAVTYETGETYHVAFTVLDWVGGDVAFLTYPGHWEGGFKVANGAYSFDMVATASFNRIGFQHVDHPPASFSVDNLSVRKVL